ncbi:hypothetical protein [Streptomyces sp. NPDC045251]|uniref:hypothetical protein n=1 Tax=unclassified Streptomyces TaxID=2593676 RepID=UPI00340A3230
MPQIHRCVRSFSFDKWTIREGTLVSADDPRFAKRKDLLTGRHFETLEDYSSRASAAVEQATADPGEKRSVTEPAKRTQPAKKTAAKQQPSKTEKEG